MKQRQPQTIGRYELKECLGEGGMGAVYLAHDPRLHRTLAVKVLSSSFNEELRQRFAREGRSAAALNHPNIVTIYDVDEDQGRPFLAMEYIDGVTLADLIRRRGLTLIRKLELILGVCTGLGYAHKLQVIHRDIKPANLMVASDGVLKILDFGLARLTSEGSGGGLTRAGTMLGTPHYMSPEQVLGNPVDHRADIFAVGLVFYELLTYRRAYPGDSTAAVLHRIAYESPQPIRELYPGLDREIERIVNTAIQRGPELRYQSLELMAADCARVLSRLKSDASEDTVKIPKGSAPPPFSPEAPDPPVQTPRPRSQSDTGHRAPVPPSRFDPEVIARRRRAEIDRYLAEATDKFDAGDDQGAIDACEQAAIVDATEPRVLELLNRAHMRIEDAQVQQWLAAAGEGMLRGDLSRAGLLIKQASELRPDAADVLTARQDLEDLKRERERARQRALAAAEALERARNSLQRGSLESAVRDAAEALTYDATLAEAEAIHNRASELLRQRREQEELARRANDASREARLLARQGDFATALERLRAFRPAHSLVAAAINDIDADRQAAERRRAEEERRRREQEELSRRAADAVREARLRAGQGEFTDALAQLREFRPEHPVVASAIADIDRDRIAAERKRAEEEERRRREEAAERERLAREEERRRELEARRRAEEQRRAEEEERRRREEAAERERLAREEDRKHEIEEQARVEEQRRREAEEQARREETARRAREEEARAVEERAAREREAVVRAEAEERHRLEAEEKARQQQIAEQQELERKAAAERAAREREDEARRRAEAEARAREAARLKQAIEEAKQRRLREEEAARKREAERQQEEERRRLEAERSRRESEERAAAEADAARQQALQRATAEQITREQEALRNADAAQRAQEEAKRRLDAARRAKDDEAARLAARRRALELLEAVKRREEEVVRQREAGRLQKLEEEKREQEEARRKAIQEEKDRETQDRRARDPAFKALQRRARAEAARARQLFVTGHYEEALQLLEAFEDRTLVAVVIEEIRVEQARLEERQRPAPPPAAPNASDDTTRNSTKAAGDRHASTPASAVKGTEAGLPAPATEHSNSGAKKPWRFWPR